MNSSRNYLLIRSELSEVNHFFKSHQLATRYFDIKTGRRHYNPNHNTTRTKNIPREVITNFNCQKMVMPNVEEHMEKKNATLMY